MATRKENYDQFIDYLKSIDSEVDYAEYVCIGDFNKDYTADELYETIDANNGFDVEIIYYDNAMRYLWDNDKSLQESIVIAKEYGLDFDDINSETLASMLASKYAREDFPTSDIDDFLSQLEWDEEKDDD